MRLQRFFGGEWYRRVFTPYVLRSIVFLRYGLFLKRHAVEGGSRLQEGRTEVIPSMAARDDRKLGVDGC